MFILRLAIWALTNSSNSYIKYVPQIWIITYEHQAFSQHVKSPVDLQRRKTQKYETLQSTRLQHSTKNTEIQVEELTNLQTPRV